MTTQSVFKGDVVTVQADGSLKVDPTTTFGAKAGTSARAPGEVSTERVQRALAMAAGDILQRSPLAPAERMRIAAEVSKLAAEYEQLASEAWEG